MTPLRNRRATLATDTGAMAVKEPATSGQIRVLVADDDRLVRLTLARAIDRQLDMVLVAEAEDGQAAVYLVGKTAPDVVIMDVNMPTMSGIEAVRRLRESGVDVPVLFFTADPRSVNSAAAIAGSTVLLKATAGIGEALAAVRAAVA
jgi:DNA-binding NarL/FixJ family response regulator